MFALFVSLSLAHAAEVPASPAPPAHTLAYNRSGDFVVYDADGEQLSKRLVLETFAGPDVAKQYARHRAVRKVGAIALWVGGGAVATGLLVESPGAGILLGGGMEGAGFALLYGPRENRVDHWLDEASLRAQIEAADGTVATDSGLYGADSRVLEARPAWELSDDGGRVRRQGGGGVRVSDVAAALGRPEVAPQAVAAERRTIVTGGGLVVGGSVVAVMGLWKAQTAYDDRLEAGGLATTVTGALLGGAGVVVLARAPRLGTPEHWFTEEELQQAVEAHNAAFADQRVVPTRAPTLTLQPQIGVGCLGVTGTF